MRECPWCGRMNLNCYSYCQRCGRGFAKPEDSSKEKSGKRWYWPFGGSKAA